VKIAALRDRVTRDRKKEETTGAPQDALDYLSRFAKKPFEEIGRSEKGRLGRAAALCTARLVEAENEPKLGDSGARKGKRR